ncbi:hypothetical protein E2C01_026891 [Portunus trituberculatus]|uniref:Uncharacterized protein n=1 Tax=Portunus trituberculatus TaxID=210409 RepID=A0A5B7EJW5_PORTR|nr:hypothetical protein [Portunus trituberculatus]
MYYCLNSLDTLYQWWQGGTAPPDRPECRVKPPLSPNNTSSLMLRPQAAAEKAGHYDWSHSVTP